MRNKVSYRQKSALNIGKHEKSYTITKEKRKNLFKKLTLVSNYFTQRHKI